MGEKYYARTEGAAASFCRVTGGPERRTENSVP